MANNIQLESTSDIMGTKNSISIVSKGTPSVQDTSEILQSTLLFLELSGHMANLKDVFATLSDAPKLYEQIKPYIEDENNDK